MVFSRKPYSRRDSLTAADTALKKGRSKKAVQEYERILENEGEDPMVLKRLAESLLAAKRSDEAKAKFLEAATLYDSQGFADKAIALYSTTVRHYPSDLSLWGRLADALARRQRTPDAVKNLLDARVHFKKRRQAQARTRLLEMIRLLEPWQFDATFELAGRLAKSGQRDEARALLLGLTERTQSAELRRSWGRMLVLFPGPRPLYRWLRAALLGR